MLDDRIQKARALRRAGRVREASGLLRSTLKEVPSEATGWYELSVTETDLGQLEGARVALEKAQALEPGALRLAWAEAEILEAEGHLDEAIVISQEIVERSPETAVFWAQLARRLCEAGRYEECHAACDEGEKQTGESVSLETQRGFCLIDQIRWKEAAHAFVRAVRLCADDPHGRSCELSCLGVSLTCVGRTRCAVACYERGLVEEPDYEELHLNLGVSLRGHDPERAERCFREAIRLDPVYVNPHSELGWVLTRMSRHEEAEEAVQTGMQLEDWDDPWSHLYLGHVFQSAKRMESAEREYRRAVEIDPEHSASRWSLASFLREQGEPVEAHEHQAEAVLRERSQPRSTFLLMRHLWDAGRRSDAEHMMRRQLAGPDPSPYRPWIRSKLAMMGLQADSGA